MTQADRLFAYLLRHPGASSLDIIRDLAIVNTTGRISDLRARGYRVDADRDKDGIFRYRLVLRPSQLTLSGQEEAVL